MVFLKLFTAFITRDRMQRKKAGLLWKALSAARWSTKNPFQCAHGNEQLKDCCGWFTTKKQQRAAPSCWRSPGHITKEIFCARCLAFRMRFFIRLKLMVPSSFFLMLLLMAIKFHLKKTLSAAEQHPKSERVRKGFFVSQPKRDFHYLCARVHRTYVN